MDSLLTKNIKNQVRVCCLNTQVANHTVLLPVTDGIAETLHHHSTLRRASSSRAACTQLWCSTSPARCFDVSSLACHLSQLSTLICTNYCARPRRVAGRLPQPIFERSLSPIEPFAVVLLFPELFDISDAAVEKDQATLMSVSGLSSLDCSLDDGVPFFLNDLDESSLEQERNLVATLFLQNVESQLRQVQIQLTLQRRTNKRQLVVASGKVGSTLAADNNDDTAVFPPALHIAEQQLLLLKVLLVQCLVRNYCRSQEVQVQSDFDEVFRDTVPVGQWGVQSDRTRYESVMRECDRLVLSARHSLQSLLGSFLGQKRPPRRTRHDTIGPLSPSVPLPRVHSMGDVRSIGFFGHIPMHHYSYLLQKRTMSLPLIAAMSRNRRLLSTIMSSRSSVERTTLRQSSGSRH